MKIKIQGIILLICLWLLIPAAAFPSGLSLGFRLYGGVLSMPGGDLNSGMSGLSRYMEIQAGLAGMSVNGSYRDLRWGYQGGGDLMVQVAPWIGLEVGGGYLRAAKESVIQYTGSPDTGQWSLKPAVTAVPVRAGIFFRAPLGSSLALVGHGGAAYYMATAETSFRLESAVTGQWRQESQKATANGLGFYGGLGLEVRIAGGLFFLIEAQGRIARIDGFEGDFDVSNSAGSSDTRSGTLYHLQAALPPGLPESSLDFLYIFGSAPSGGGLTSVREARVDFGGFGVVAGFSIRL